MADFDLAQLQEMKKWADFGKAVIELAKNHGFVPKRQLVKVRTVEKIKVVTRRPRRTKAEMAAAAAAPQQLSLPVAEGDAPSALDSLMK